MQAADHGTVDESLKDGMAVSNETAGDLNLTPSSASIAAEPEGRSPILKFKRIYLPVDTARPATTLEDNEDLPPNAGQIDELPEVEETRSSNADQTDVEAFKEVAIVEEVGDEVIASDAPVHILVADDEPIEDPTERESDPNPSEAIQVIEQPATVVIAGTPEKPDTVVEEPTIGNDAAILSTTEEPSITEQPIGEEWAPIAEPIEIVEEPVIIDDALPASNEPVVAEGPTAEELAPILESAEVVEEPVEEPVEAEEPVMASDSIEEAPVSTSEQPVAAVEEPVAEEVADDDVAVGQPAHDPLVSIAVEGQVQDPIEEIVVDPAPTPVQPVAAVEKPIVLEATADNVNVAAASAHESHILAVAEGTIEGSAGLSGPVPEEAIEIIEEPVQGLEEPVVAENVTESEAGEIVEVTPAIEDSCVAEDTIDGIAVQSPLISQDPAQPIQEALTTLEDSRADSEVVNVDVIESVPVQDEIITNFIEGSITAGDVVESSLTDLTPVQGLEEVAPVGIEEPTTTGDEVIADVPADSTNGEYSILLSWSWSLNVAW